MGAIEKAPSLREMYIEQRVEKMLASDAWIGQLAYEIMGSERFHEFREATLQSFTDMGSCWDGDSKLYQIYRDFAEKKAAAEWDAPAADRIMGDGEGDRLRAEELSEHREWYRNFADRAERVAL